SHRGQKEGITHFLVPTPIRKLSFGTPQLGLPIVAWRCSPHHPSSTPWVGRSPPLLPAHNSHEDIPWPSQKMCRQSLRAETRRKTHPHSLCNRAAQTRSGGSFPAAWLRHTSAVP